MISNIIYKWYRAKANCRVPISYEIDYNAQLNPLYIKRDVEKSS